ncbi:hypothetical protein SAMN05518855_1018105 [Paenibacillus sp. CF384]|nr:hypothetical protein SAMN05518855_1018105 [Paenibacillus sp. CF384]
MSGITGFSAQEANQEVHMSEITGFSAQEANQEVYMSENAVNLIKWLSYPFINKGEFSYVYSGRLI